MKRRILPAPLAAALLLALGGPLHAQSTDSSHDAAEHHHPAAPASPPPAGHGHAQMDHSAMDRSTLDHSTEHDAAIARDHAPNLPLSQHEGHDVHRAHKVHDGNNAPQPSAPSPQPANHHIPPPAPSTDIGQLSHAEMDALMGMNDSARFGRFTFDRLEHLEGGAAAWGLQAWYGGDTNRVHLRSEGERSDGRVEHADAELLWSRAIAPFWDSQLGIRRDFGEGPGRTWAAFGVQGLAPYWFELSATAYLGEQGRTALRVEAEYELLLTQRLVLQPRLELEAYGKDDPARGIGSGLSNVQAGLRLRYEIRREFAPYVGIERSRAFGGTAEDARAAGHGVDETRWVAGLRFWF